MSHERRDIAALAVTEGAAVDVKTVGGITPLMVAASEGKEIGPLEYIRGRWLPCDQRGKTGLRG